MEIEVVHTGYRPNWLVGLLHSMPHLDFSLELVNSTFNIDNVKYKESLIFWASLPVLMLLLMLMSLLAYLVFRCICKLRYEEEQEEGEAHTEPHEGSLQGIQNCLTCLRWTSTSLAIIACGTSAVGFYGNRLTHKGLSELTDSLNYVVYSSYMAKNQLILLKTSLGRISKGIHGMRNVFENSMKSSHYSLDDNQSTFNYHLTELNKALEHNKDVLRDIQAVVDLESTSNLIAKENMHRTLISTKQYEFYRWLVMIVVFSWLIILFLLLLIGIAKNSKCLLLLFCSFGILSLVASCLSASIHLAIAIGISDFCYYPESSVIDILTHYMDRKLAAYYIKCDPIHIANPFRDHFLSAQTNLFDVQTYVYHILRVIKEDEIKKEHFVGPMGFVDQGLNEAAMCIVKLLALIDCNNLHNDYQNAVKGVCLATLPGIAISVMLCTLLAILLTTLVFLVIKLWRVFRPLHDSIIKPSQDLIASESFQHDQSADSSGSLCRQYSGLINPSDSCGAIRESIA